MEIINSGEVIINKSLYNDIKKFYSDIFSKPRLYDSSNVVIQNSELKELVRALKNDLTITNINYAKNISDDVDKTSFLSALDLYEKDLSNVSKSAFDNKNDHHLYDNLIISGLKLKEEIKKITLTPYLIKKISKMILNIDSDNLSDNEPSLKDKLKALRKAKGTYEDYNNFALELSNYIGKSYNDNITDINLVNSSPNLRLIVSEDEERSYLLTEKNIKRASFGLILSSKDNIKSASNKEGDEDLLPFDKLDKKDNYIEVYDNKPVACFAITLGEKTLSKNYLNAQDLQRKYHNLPLIEIDISRFVSLGDSKEYFNELVDRLLDDKNVTIAKKDEELYAKFENFFKEYKFLKAKTYDESNIRNLFDFNVKLITSQEVCDLDKLLNNYSLGEIETVLKHNLFLDYNIFRYHSITKAMVERFIDKFYNYRLDESLNKIYPGFNSVLTYFKSLNDEDLKEMVESINNGNIVDSWLIAQTVDPIHSSYLYATKSKDSKVFKEYKSEKLNQIQNEIEELLTLKEYLSSKDEDKIKKLVSAM